MPVAPARFIFVTGGVMSGIGKGVVTSSIAKCLQVRGYKVRVAKIDPYLNVDAGTMNPYQHGEVFVTDDGGEIDVDFGHYERMLDINLKRERNITTGQIYWQVIGKERHGDYLGQTIQIIPHITDEIKKRILAEDDCDVALVEIGGTVGDIEGLPFLEAVRQLRFEIPQSVHVHVTYVPRPAHLHEPKTKPTQHSVRKCMEIGLQPDILVCRSQEKLESHALEKIALFSNIKGADVFVLPDLGNIYQAPMVLDRQDCGKNICAKLGFNTERVPEWGEWEQTVSQFSNEGPKVRIAMIGKYSAVPDAYISVIEALRHAAAVCSVQLSIGLVAAEQFEKSPQKLDALQDFDGIVVPGGFGSRGADGKISSIAFARENNIPFLGLCFGMQLAVVEFAMNACKMEDASSTEIDPETSVPIIDILPEQKAVKELGGTMRLGSLETRLLEGSLAYYAYGEEKTIFERHRHRFEVNPKYVEELRRMGLSISGASPDGIVDIIELTSHKFFVGTQFHPEFKSRPGKPAPLFLAFMRAAAGSRRQVKEQKILTP